MGKKQKFHFKTHKDKTRMICECGCDFVYKVGVHINLGRGKYTEVCCPRCGDVVERVKAELDAPPLEVYTSKVLVDLGFSRSDVEELAKTEILVDMYEPPKNVGYKSRLFSAKSIQAIEKIFSRRSAINPIREAGEFPNY